jgi:hypothetical protein
MSCIDEERAAAGGERARGELGFGVRGQGPGVRDGLGVLTGEHGGKGARRRWCHGSVGSREQAASPAGFWSAGETEWERVIFSFFLID